MWGHKWGHLLWHTFSDAREAIGPWGLVLLGGLLGIFAVLYWRNARKVGLAVSLLVLLIPLSALAGVPFVFVSGTIPNALQLNADFAAVIPIVGQSQASGSTSGTALLFAFPSTPSFVAPRDLTCVVTVQPFVITNLTNAQIAWRPAIKLGSTTSAPGVAPGELSLSRMPFASGADQNYASTYTTVVSVPTGTAVSFGARFQPVGSPFYIYSVSAVYHCTPPP